MSHPIFLGLGSNVDAERSLQEAVRLLSMRVTILNASRVYRSLPIGKDGKPRPDRPPFLNAALLVESDLPPDRLKAEVLGPIEAVLGRQRPAEDPLRHSIDIDILMYGDQVVDPDTLTRGYAALPLADLAPDFIHPTVGETLRAIAARFRDDPDLSPLAIKLLD